MIDYESIRSKIISETEAIRNQMSELAIKIHASPELGLEEQLASEWLCEELKKGGFHVEKGVAGLATAFVGKCVRNTAAPQIGFIAEYDALPDIGHGCGHNLIGPAAIGAASVLSRALPDELMNLAVFGTPAEENAGGKIPMLDAGLFRDTGVVMMFHPHNEDVAACPMISRAFLIFEFFGKSAHASAFPWDGVNALDAMILIFNNINALRQQIKPEARVHGIITHGGLAANIIPEYTRAEFYVRARDIGYLEELLQKVRQCAEAAAAAAGCRVKISTPLPAYLSDLTITSLADVMEENMKALGLSPEKAVPPLGSGSSDFGNVSRQVPALLSYLKVAPKGVVIHSKAFAEAAATEEAREAMINAIKAMALTTCDILTNPDLLDQIRNEFIGLKEDM